MKWYLASRTRHQEKLVELSQLLEEQDQTILSDWVYVGSMKPFMENIIEVQQLVEHNINQILQADIFVVFNDLEGTDLLTETGVALAAAAMGRDLKIYVVGNQYETSMMQLDKNVVHVEKFSQILDAENLAVIDFDL